MCDWESESAAFRIQCRRITASGGWARKTHRAWLRGVWVAPNTGLADALSQRS